MSMPCNDVRDWLKRDFDGNAEPSGEVMETVGSMFPQGWAGQVSEVGRSAAARAMRSASRMSTLPESSTSQTHCVVVVGMRTRAAIWAAFRASMMVGDTPSTWQSRQELKP